MSETVRWWWIRHAPSQGEPGIIHGQDDVAADLSDKEAFARVAARLPAGAVWMTSSIRRTKETAHALNETAEPFEIADFDEQSFGDWNGQQWSDLKQEKTAAFWDNYAEVRPPGGESYLELSARVSAKIAELNARYSDTDLVVVAHAGTIRAALSLALNLPPTSALSLKIANLSLSRIDAYQSGGKTSWAVEAVSIPPI